MAGAPAAARLKHNGLPQRSERWLQRLPRRVRQLLFIVVAIAASLLALLCISQPFDITTQFVFVLLWALAMLVRRMPGPAGNHHAARVSRSPSPAAICDSTIRKPSTETIRSA